jgi:hypothetical protein
MDDGYIEIGCSIFMKGVMLPGHGKVFEVLAIGSDVDVLICLHPLRDGEGDGQPNYIAVRRDVIKHDFGGKLPSGRPFRPDIRARPRLPRGRGFTCGRVFTVRRRGKNRVRADANKKIKIKIYFYFYFYFYF